MARSLSLATLPHLGADVARPAYTRASLSPGIVHIGVGNFHRAHMATYLDDLFNLGRGHDWAIVGAGVTASDSAMRDRLQAQDWLSTVVERDAERAAARIVGSMIDFVSPSDRVALVARMASRDVRIVSLTITEGGYFLDASGRFDRDHPLVRRDVANPGNPETAFGLVVAALKRRWASGLQPLTVLSCDNVPHNGDVTRAAVTELADRTNPALARWIDSFCAFPNSMVDRIAPAVGDRERAFVAATFGIADAAPVPCEPFRQWVIEDRFAAGRPPLEAVGVTFVDDVTSYELAKIRILNGGHAALAYPAGLLGVVFVHDAMAHPLLASWLAKLHRREVMPHVPPIPGVDLQAYRDLVAERFANPAIEDTVQRLCFDGSGRQPKFIVPAVRDALAAGTPLEGLALASALWCRYCRGVAESGDPIGPNDPAWERLQATARAAEGDPAAWLAMDDIYGETGTAPRFREAFGRALQQVATMGALGAIAAYLEDSPDA